MKKLKILMFCHHPDVLHYKWKAFTELGHDVYIASEELAYSIGFEVSSVKDNKFEVVDQLFEPAELFPDMADVKFADSIQKNEYDIIWSMIPNIIMLEKMGETTWFDCQMQGHLHNPDIQKIPTIKTSNHPQSHLFNYKWVPNWVDVDAMPELKEKKYITQIITEIDKVDTTNELLELRNKGLPVKLYGGNKCPDGFIRDIDILPETGMLVHNKTFGINCYSVCKALAMGIPVYMSQKTQEMIGFGDLPKECFIYKEDYSIEEAWNLVKSKPKKYNENIKKIYRSIYTTSRLVAAIESIIEDNKEKIEK
jgi:hypothetical protein